jgi:hypothetical protein
MPHIISASRRTDIPAFYADWFVHRLQAGMVYVRQPYSQKMARISLAPQDVNAIVFWSKNYAPLLKKLEAIEHTTKNLLFHFTITANRELELNAPGYQDAIGDYRYLVARYTPEQLFWRYDPVCITDKLSFEAHEERFSQCAELLQGFAKRCIISFVHPYKKVLSNMLKYTDHHLVELSIDQKKEYAERLAQRAASYGITLYACCNDYLLSDHIQKAACIDGQYLSSLFRTPLDTRPALLRKECACTKSTDIGAYDTCAHGCVYCYANSNKERANAAPQRQDPAWNALGMNVDENDVKIADGQQNLFKSSTLNPREP